MSAQPKVSFENGGDFMRDIRREVDVYLEAGRTRLRGDVQLYVKSVVAFAILASSWASLIFLHPGIALGLIALGGLSLGTILVGFCIQPDANHGPYFRTRRANHLHGWTADALPGHSHPPWP